MSMANPEKLFSSEYTRGVLGGNVGSLRTEISSGQAYLAKGVNEAEGELAERYIRVLGGRIERLIELVGDNRAIDSITGILNGDKVIRARETKADVSDAFDVLADFAFL